MDAKVNGTEQEKNKRAKKLSDEAWGITTWQISFPFPTNFWTVKGWGSLPSWHMSLRQTVLLLLGKANASRSFQE
jgi:hypothetical protein